MSISRNILLQLITQVTGVISGFLVSVITARMLGTVGRGEFALFITSLNFLSTFFGISLNYSILYITSSQKFDLSKTLKTSFMMAFVLLALCILLFMTEQFFNFHFFFQNKSFLVNMLLLFTFFQMLISGILGGVMTGKLLFTPMQVSAVIVSILNIGLYACYFLYMWKEIGDGISVRNFIVIYSAIAFIPMLVNVYLFLRLAMPKSTPGLLNFSQVKFILSYAAVAYAANVFLFFTAKMDFYLVDHFKGKGELGIYSLAVNLTRLIYLIPLGISSVMIAYNASDSLERVVNNINKLLRISTLIILVACIVAYPIMDFFITFSYGIDFARSAGVFKILLAGMIPLSAIQILTSFFGGRAKLIHNLVAMIILFGCTALFDYLLIPRYGITGASWSSVFSYFASFAYMVFVYRQMTISALSEMFYITTTDLQHLKLKMLDFVNLFRKKKS